EDHVRPRWEFRTGVPNGIFQPLQQNTVRSPQHHVLRLEQQEFRSGHEHRAGNKPTTGPVRVEVFFLGQHGTRMMDRIGLRLCSGLLAMASVVASSSPILEATQPQGLDFTHPNSPTAQKYLIETMGGGVALLDYNNDGLLDIFLVNSGKLMSPM